MKMSQLVESTAVLTNGNTNYPILFTTLAQEKFGYEKKEANARFSLVALYIIGLL
ncbi:hypothetical protein [Brevibacillus sp. DP1.3A]|uniref:hypothetical protein n=1 Tax=Brevibacillus sp. DP1.3A TaxID=2738867 RepID=UPI00156BCD3B|nr:hypothetical protein [Brevibacillus sp. DP1.3A]UED73150.1 hypothetical protein HP399_020715 [Brevibacillus sp. DP1.3A]